VGAVGRKDTLLRRVRHLDRRIRRARLALSWRRLGCLDDLEPAGALPVTAPVRL